MSRSHLFPRKGPSVIKHRKGVPRVADDGVEKELSLKYEDNLKRQIFFLEKEVQYLKDKGEKPNIHEAHEAQKLRTFAGTAGSNLANKRNDNDPQGTSSTPNLQPKTPTHDLTIPRPPSIRQDIHSTRISNGGTTSPTPGPLIHTCELSATNYRYDSQSQKEELPPLNEITGRPASISSHHTLLNSAISESRRNSAPHISPVPLPHPDIQDVNRPNTPSHILHTTTPRNDDPLSDFMSLRIALPATYISPTLVPHYNSATPHPIMHDQSVHNDNTSPLVTRSTSIDYPHISYHATGIQTDTFGHRQHSTQVSPRPADFTQTTPRTTYGKYASTTPRNTPRNPQENRFRDAYTSHTPRNESPDHKIDEIISERDQAINELEKERQTRDEEIRKYKYEITRYQEQYDELITKMKEENKQILIITEELRLSKLREEKLNQQLEDQKNETQRQIKLLLQEKDEEREKLVTEIISLEKDLESGRLQLKTLEEELQDLVQLKDEQILDITVLKDEKKELELQLESVMSHQKSTEMELQLTQEQLRLTKNNLQESKMKMASDESAEYTILRNENKELEAEQRRLELKIKQLKLEKTQETDMRINLQKELQTLVDSQVRSQQDEAEWNKQRQQYSSQIDAIEKSKKEIEKERDDLIKVQEESNAQIRELTVHFDKCKQELDELRKQKSELELQLHKFSDELQRQKHSFSAKEQHYNQMDTLNSELRKDNRILSDELNNQKNMLEQWRTRSEELECVCLERKSHIEELQHQLTSRSNLLSDSEIIQLKAIANMTGTSDNQHQQRSLVSILQRAVGIP